MYCLVYTRSSLCTAALIFYTILWLPLVQLKKSLLQFVSPRALENSHELQLPAARFGDLQRSRPSRCNASDEREGEEEEEEEEEEKEGVLCSICLAEIEEEDAVSELPGCSHIFHCGCIERWLEKCQFTCPLCRSLLFDQCKLPQHS